MLLQTNTILLFANTMLLNLKKVGQNVPACAIWKRKSVVMTKIYWLVFDCHLWNSARFCMQAAPIIHLLCW